MTPEERARTPCYIGRSTKPTEHHPEGTVVCAIVDDGRDPKGTANTIAKWIRGGLAIERVPVWWVRINLETTAVYRGEEMPKAEGAP